MVRVSAPGAPAGTGGPPQGRSKRPYVCGGGLGLRRLIPCLAKAARHGAPSSIFIFGPSLFSFRLHAHFTCSNMDRERLYGSLARWGGWLLPEFPSLS